METTYFEEVLLKENQRNIAWLLSEFDPDADQRDELLLANIIGKKKDTEEEEEEDDTA